MIYAVEEHNNYHNFERTPIQHSLKVLECKKMKFEAGYSYQIIPLDYSCCFYLLSGKMALSPSGQTVRKRDFLVMPKFSHLTLHFPESTEVIRLSFDYSKSIPMLKKDQPFLLPSNSTLRGQMEKLYQVKQQKDSLPGTCEGILLSLLNDIHHISCYGFSEQTLYQKTCVWLDNNANRSITAHEIAEAMGCSREHLNRVVKKISGECLSELIIKARLREIKQLCAAGALSVTEIANRLDFSSPELLSKFFRYHTGESISRYQTTHSMDYITKRLSF